MNFHWRSASGEKRQFFAKLFHIISVVGLSQMSCPPLLFSVGQPPRVVDGGARKSALCHMNSRWPGVGGVRVVSGTHVWFPALLAAGVQKGTEGGGSTTLSHLPDWTPEATDVKLGTIFPSPCPFLIHWWMVPQGWRLCCLTGAESLTSSFYTNLPCGFLSISCVSYWCDLILALTESSPSISGL